MTGVYEVSTVVPYWIRDAPYQNTPPDAKKTNCSNTRCIVPMAASASASMWQYCNKAEKKGDCFKPIGGTCL